MEKVYGKPVHNKWVGISIKKDDDSSDDSDDSGFHMV